MRWNDNEWRLMSGQCAFGSRPPQSATLSFGISARAPHE